MCLSCVCVCVSVYWGYVGILITKNVPLHRDFWVRRPIKSDLPPTYGFYTPSEPLVHIPDLLHHGALPDYITRDKPHSKCDLGLKSSSLS